MKTHAMIAAGALLLSAGMVRAEEHPEMMTAQRELESAKSHLQAAAHDYGGHRKQAIEDIDRALGQIKEGLAVVEKTETKVEHKEQKVERKGPAAEGELEKLKAREHQLEH